MKELVALPKPVPDVRVLIGTTVRKPPEVLTLYLRSLERLILPPGVSVSYCFVDDNADPQSSEMLRAFVEARGGSVLGALSLGPSTAPGEYDDSNPTTHQWTANSMGRVGQLKNHIIRHSLENRFDAVFFVDADLVLEPTTLASLVSLDSPVACAVYWTRWVNNPGIHAAPQVWLSHPYILRGRGYKDEGEFRAKLLSRAPTLVWGQGACSLVKRHVFEKGVDFTIIPDLPKEGMWQGEDRSFCIKCERLHIPMVADPWPDIFHVYHPSDKAKAAEWFDLLGEVQSGRPGAWDLVAVRIDALESGTPFPLSRFVRGKLGQVKFLPEIAHAISQMERGDSALVAAHIPLHYPLVPYRNTRRLFRVTLVDHKPFRFPPIVTDEIYQWKTGPVQDGTDLTMEQHAGLVEEATA